MNNHAARFLSTRLTGTHSLSPYPPLLPQTRWATSALPSAAPICNVCYPGVLGHATALRSARPSSHFIQSACCLKILVGNLCAGHAHLRGCGETPQPRRAATTGRATPIWSSVATNGPKLCVGPSFWRGTDFEDGRNSWLRRTVGNLPSRKLGFLRVVATLRLRQTDRTRQTDQWEAGEGCHR